MHAPTLLFRNSYPYSLNSPLTYLESLLCVVARIPVHSDPWAVYWPPPFLPIPFSPSPTVPPFQIYVLLRRHCDIGFTQSDTSRTQNGGRRGGKSIETPSHPGCQNSSKSIYQICIFIEKTPKTTLIYINNAIKNIPDAFRYDYINIQKDFASGI